MSLLDTLFGRVRVKKNGTLLPNRSYVDISGDGVDVEDDPANDRIALTISGGSTSFSGDVVKLGDGSLSTIRLRGATVEAAGALVTGKVPTVTGPSALSYLAIDVSGSTTALANVGATKRVPYSNGTGLLFSADFTWDDAAKLLTLNASHATDGVSVSYNSGVRTAFISAGTNTITSGAGVQLRINGHSASGVGVTAGAISIFAGGGASGANAGDCTVEAGIATGGGNGGNFRLAGGDSDGGRPGFVEIVGGNGPVSFPTGRVHLGYRNLILGQGATGWADGDDHGMVGGLFLRDVTTEPTSNAQVGMHIWSLSGRLKARSGTSAATAYSVWSYDSAGRVVDWGLLTNNNIDPAAAIVVTKLQLGGINQILWSNGTANSWTGAPIIATSLQVGTSATGALSSGVTTHLYNNTAVGTSLLVLKNSNAAGVTRIGFQDSGGGNVGFITFNSTAASTYNSEGVSFRVYSGQTQQANLDGSGSAFLYHGRIRLLDGDGSVSPTYAIELGDTSGITGASYVIGAIDTNGTPQTLTVRGAGSTVSGSNGAPVAIQGGKGGGGTGRRGAVQLQLWDGSTAQTMVGVAEPVLNQRVVALARGADLTNTQMPANTGDLVVYVANCATAPTAAPVAGAVIYADGGALKAITPSGTITTLAAADPHCPKCGRDFTTEWSNVKTYEKLAICTPCMLDALGAAGIDTAFAFERHLHEAA